MRLNYIDNIDCLEGLAAIPDGSVDLVVSRGGKERQLHLEPKITEEGPKLGVFLRQGITGIGTVTWYDPETGSFATLGHAAFSLSFL